MVTSGPWKGNPVSNKVACNTCIFLWASESCLFMFVMLWSPSLIFHWGRLARVEITNLGIGVGAKQSDVWVAGTKMIYIIFIFLPPPSRSLWPAWAPQRFTIQHCGYTIVNVTLVHPKKTPEMEARTEVIRRTQAKWPTAKWEKSHLAFLCISHYLSCHTLWPSLRHFFHQRYYYL